MGFLSGSAVKNLPAMQEMHVQSLSGRSSGGGHGNSLQYSCLENPMDREAWRATIQESQRVTSEATLHVHTHTSYSRGTSEMVSPVVPSPQITSPSFSASVLSALLPLLPETIKLPVPTGASLKTRN